MIGFDFVASSAAVRSSSQEQRFHVLVPALIILRVHVLGRLARRLPTEQPNAFALHLLHNVDFDLALPSLLLQLIAAVVVIVELLLLDGCQRCRSAATIFCRRLYRRDSGR